MPAAAQRQRELEQACLALLIQHPQGLSEYQLLKCLRKPPYGLLPTLELGDHLGLFQSHFLIYHSLYRLRERLLAEQRSMLQISALRVGLDAYEPGEAALCEVDPLRDYYLDLANLDATGEAEVAALLDAFWRCVPVAADSEGVVSALAVLELDAASDFDQVKRQYRRLVMRHHPDRGGEAARMHALNEALELLRHHYTP